MSTHKWTAAYIYIKKKIRGTSEKYSTLIKTLLRVHERCYLTQHKHSRLFPWKGWLHIERDDDATLIFLTFLYANIGCNNSPRGAYRNEKRVSTWTIVIDCCRGIIIQPNRIVCVHLKHISRVPLWTRAVMSQLQLINRNA